MFQVYKDSKEILPPETITSLVKDRDTKGLTLYTRSLVHPIRTSRRNPSRPKVKTKVLTEENDIFYFLISTR